MSVSNHSNAQYLPHTSKSPINTSTAKALYSFSQSQRFPKDKQPYCNNSFYEMPSTKTPRTTTLGLGSRFGDMINKQEAPSPQKYQLQSLDFNPKGKGFNFGASRDAYSKVYLKEHPAPDLAIPGPGSYKANLTITQRNSGSFTLGPKTTFQSIFNDFTKNNPGPGAYGQAGQVSLNNDKNVISKYKNPGVIKISRTGKRFDESFIKRSLNNPGPGSYTPESAVNSTGKYFANKYKNSLAPLFPKEERNVQLDNHKGGKITPGPGSYRVQSEFGFYDPKDQVPAMKSQRNQAGRRSFLGHSQLILSMKTQTFDNDTSFNGQNNQNSP